MSKKKGMPLEVWILTLAAFAIGTAEFVIAGLLTKIADTLNISDGKAGNLITAYALAIVIGGPILTLWLAKYEKKKVLIGLTLLFVIGNLLSATTNNYYVLLISRFITGLTQGPFYGIGAVVASRLVAPNQAGQAVGQMFAGLTLANVLGVPAGTWIGHTFGWNITFYAVAFLGLATLLAVMSFIPRQTKEDHITIGKQLAAFANRNLLASLFITSLCWTGFMTFYGYIAPIAENVAGYSANNLTWLLVLVGVGLVIGNYLGGITSDKNLRLSLILWPLSMVVSLIIIGFVQNYYWLFTVASFIFGVTSFSNVPPMQMRVMKYGTEAPELSATANISAFNIANALGGFIGSLVIDSSLGASGIAFTAIILPIIGILFVLTQERGEKSPKTEASS